MRVPMTDDFVGDSVYKAKCRLIRGWDELFGKQPVFGVGVRGAVPAEESVDGRDVYVSVPVGDHRAQPLLGAGPALL